MRLVSWLILLFINLMPSFSYALDKPKGRVILTVSGAIDVSNSDQGAEFDLAMLQALPQYSVTTQNPWIQGTHTYTGFSAMDLLNRLNNKGTILQTIALNKYMTEIPIEDFAENKVILATHIDGKPMNIRQLGPIMVIYPFDSNENFKSEIFYSRSIWQVRHIKSIILAE